MAFRLAVFALLAVLAFGALPAHADYVCEVCNIDVSDGNATASCERPSPQGGWGNEDCRIEVWQDPEGNGASMWCTESGSMCYYLEVPED